MQVFDPPLTAKGYNGTITFDGKIVTIDRKGFVAWLSQGSSSKTIPVSRIHSVQYDPGNLVRNGYVRFSVQGDEQAHSRTFAWPWPTAGEQRVADAYGDPNAVLVRPWRRGDDDFTPLVDAINAALAEQ